MRETIMRSLAAGVLLLVFQLTAFAQTTGSIKGTVTDPNGALLAGASVTSKNNATGIEQTVVTKDDGVFLFTALQPGTYTLGLSIGRWPETVFDAIDTACDMEVAPNPAHGGVRPRGDGAVRCDMDLRVA